MAGLESTTQAGGGEMKTLSNQYQDMEVVDLDAAPERRGPYLVMQTGVAPHDPTVRERLFILRPDGQWAELNAYLSAGRPELLDEVVFTSMDELLAVVGDLSGEACVEELPVSKAGLQAWLVEHPAGSMLERLNAWLADYWRRRQADASPPA